jgi:outer membrane biosynthesis protein TonB
MKHHFSGQMSKQQILCDCGLLASKKTSRWGLFYGCSKFGKGGCRFSCPLETTKDLSLKHQTELKEKVKELKEKDKIIASLVNCLETKQTEKVEEKKPENENVQRKLEDEIKKLKEENAKLKKRKLEQHIKIESSRSQRKTKEKRKRKRRSQSHPFSLEVILDSEKKRVQQEIREKGFSHWGGFEKDRARLRWMDLKRGIHMVRCSPQLEKEWRSFILECDKQLRKEIENKEGQRTLESTLRVTPPH